MDIIVFIKILSVKPVSQFVSQFVLQSALMAINFMIAAILTYLHWADQKYFSLKAKKIL